MPLKGINIDKVREVLKDCSVDELRSIRGIINGKLSHRTIKPDQQKMMQEAKKKKKA